ncbi:MAG: A/G-specific adenine glycosylase [Gammaproteobacteria bacterium]|nr:A/G-specific adenine glycosylase [Gammaproteobacteria bacterium]
MAGFHERLTAWFDHHGRKDLPWQAKPTAYRVWISEIMLQQTQVATVIPYYLRFMEQFPTVASLAGSSMDAVLHAWSGLGYYARARNLHQAAITIRDDHNGEFPLEMTAVMDLPGIGRSTAGAILALADQQRHAILDGNVKRVLARYHAIEGWPGTTAVAKVLWEFAEEHTPHERVADYTQAIMDLGATRCTRTRPQCATCPLSADCCAHKLGRETDYPGKRPKKTRPLKTTHMLLAHHEGALYLERRPPQGIWGGLWSLPEFTDMNAVLAWCEQTLNTSALEVEQWDTLRHSFSHYDLEIKPVAVRLESPSGKVADTDQALWYKLAAPPGIGLATPVKTLIDNLHATGTL